ncbi:hypothetical protein FBQ96_05740 [Nitrospirales bacterium NOB]|nr:MAG: hypothetical protein UZ03_NOB001002508 [Nitrospira sp. OLB3]MBV6469244.1 hypothetical protein [Nitrospirota bacterium]MCE7964792.1 hypothetical protein [Nitrospira sp. NTP2]MCK6492542.1 hypothetical protein [Nitrospira sp.]MDL1889073.1 hypothetical protein [Nitrospirales bacterium NOB]MEB2337788.1 hypothetical protein [Nitrospirales bacterium]
MQEERIAQALELFALTPPFTKEQLEERRRQLLHTWNPPRYANLTNHPKQYMKAYRQAEAMTEQIHRAYGLLTTLADGPEPSPGDAV